MQKKYLLRHLETPPGVSQVSGDFHMCFDLSVCSFLQQRFCGEQIVSIPEELLISVLQQLSASFAFMVITVRSEDPDPAQGWASPELHERVPV